MLKLGSDEEWCTVKDFVPQISAKTKSYNQAFIMKEHNHACRVITTRRSPPQRRRFFHSDRRTFFHSLSKKNYNLLLDFFKSFCLKLGPLILIISE